MPYVKTEDNNNLLSPMLASHRINITRCRSVREPSKVSQLPFSGCSTIVVRRSLVPDEKLTGQEECCILIDGSIRHTPVAKIYVDTPYYSGLTTAVCMKNTIYDLIVGNIEGVRDSMDQQQLLHPVSYTHLTLPTNREV